MLKPTCGRGPLGEARAGGEIGAFVESEGAPSVGSSPTDDGPKSTTGMDDAEVELFDVSVLEKAFAAGALRFVSGDTASSGSGSRGRNAGITNLAMNIAATPPSAIETPIMIALNVFDGFGRRAAPVTGRRTVSAWLGARLRRASG